MSKIDIEQLRALPDYVKPTDWGVAFPVLPVVGALGGFASDDLNLRAETVSIPKPTSEIIEVMTKGHKTHQNGRTEISGSLPITFNDTVDNVIFNFVKAWREITKDFRTGKQFSKSEVEAVCVVTQYDANDNAIRAYEFVGCIWETDDFGELDSATSDIMRPSLTLKYDYFRPISLRA
jgi:hypothetical protein